MYVFKKINNIYLQLPLNHKDTILRNSFIFLQEHFLYNHSNVGIKYINTHLEYRSKNKAIFNRHLMSQNKQYLILKLKERLCLILSENLLETQV